MQTETYLHQLSASVQEYPYNIFPEQVPMNLKSVATSPFYFLSLAEAKEKRFTILSPNNDGITAKTITNYVTVKPSDSDLWQYVQVGWNDYGKFGAVLIKNVKTGKYLCVDESYNPKCFKYGHLDKDRYVWVVQDRGVYFLDPKLKYFTYNITQDGKLDILPPKTLQEYKKCQKNNTCNFKFNPSFPVAGEPFKPFLRIGANGKVEMGTVIERSYFIPEVYKDFWGGNSLSNTINEIQNCWYPLLYRGNNDLCLAPVSQGMGIGELMRWTPDNRYAEKFNRCNVELKKRFLDPATQTKPKQSPYPKTMFGFTSAACERYNETRGPGFGENFEFWQYLDIFMYIAYNQGWPPIELANLSIPAEYSNEPSGSLFDYLEGFIGQDGSGIFSVPPKSYVEAAHMNGCKLFSVLFFQQNVFGGKWKWWDTFLKNKELIARKLVDFAEYYGIDGYFVNFEAQPPGAVKDTPNTNCEQYKDDVCVYNECKGYWCQYTKGGNNNCDGKECTLGKWDGDKNIGTDGSDINKQGYIDFLKYFRAYREKKGVNVEVTMYASMGYGGDSSNYTSGITDYMVDLWINPQTKQPIVDNALSMPPGGQNYAEQIKYTFARTSEAINECIDEAETKENYTLDGWPNKTGPQDKMYLSPDLKCGVSGADCSGGNTGQDCDCTGDDCGDKNQCLSSGCCYDDSQPDDKPWCYVPKKGKRGVVCGSECGALTTQDAKIPPNRAFDFYVGTTGEVSKPNNGWQYGYGSGENWDKKIYCSDFDGCKNYEEAIQAPLSSFFLWAANLAQGGQMGTANLSRTYKLNTELYTSLYIGKTAICYKDLALDPYTNVHDMGLCHYVTEKSCISNLPFHTNFCLGNGNNFYINGKPQLYYGTWIDNIQDYLPTWRWWPKQITKKLPDGTYLESKILSLDYTKAYQGGNSIKVKSMADMVDTDFYLFKTKLPTNKPIELSIVLCMESFMRNKSNSSLSIGYVLGSQGNLVSGPEINYFDLTDISTSWNRRTFKIPTYQNDYISAICLKCKAPMSSLETYSGYIGEISLIPYGYSSPAITPSLTIEGSHKPSDMDVSSYDISWNNMPGVKYYNIYNGNYFIGRVYGTCSDSKPKLKKVWYNIQNVKGSPRFSVEAICLNGERKRGFSTFNPLLIGFLLGVGFLTTLLLLYLTWMYLHDKTISNTWFYISGVGVMLVIILLSFLFFGAGSMPNIHYVPSNTGHLGMASAIIETWPMCKRKALNINWDDNRPKIWSWYFREIKRRKLPIKTTLFINTLWLNRDLELYKEWMKQGLVDFGAHGHWHFNHTQDNFVAPSGVDCWKNPEKCCPTNSDMCVTDDQLAENDSVCAYYIRKYLYKDMNKEMVYAYPYGALPFDNDGNPKQKNLDVLKKNFLAARSVTWGIATEFPFKDDPNSLQVTCNNYQGQPAGCDGACSVDACSVYQKGNPYDQNITNNIGPEFCWPAGIDMNVDPGCENCDIVRQMDIRENSLQKLLESDSPLAIMVWGHSFHPTIGDVTYPIDYSYTMGGCGDNQACKNNAKAMFDLTGNRAWLDAKEDYKCPEDIAKPSHSCAKDCVRGKIDKNGNCTDPDVFKTAHEHPFDYYQIQSYDPPGMKPSDCNSCGEGWNPSIGSQLFKMLELTKDRNDIWFAFFVEIVQYLWNRKFTKLSYEGMYDNTIQYTLESTNVMRDYPITVSFPVKVDKVTVDGKKVVVEKADLDGKWYIQFKPNDNSRHKIKATFTS